MREIKFRAWDKYKKEWLGGIDGSGSEGGFNLLGECTLIGGILDQPYYTQNVFERLYRDVIVMQYTGLHDKNGKEIYEGDIVHNTAKYYKPDIHSIYEVKYRGSCFIAFGRNNRRKYLAQLQKDEIIGNIHENPELLNQKESNLE